MLEQADVLDYDTDSNTTEIVRSYQHCSASTSVVEATDASQAEVMSYRYEPYGDVVVWRNGVLQAGDPSGQRQTFRGGAHDYETGFVRGRSRDLNSALGRLNARDSEVAVETRVYEYSFNRPTAIIDSLRSILRTGLERMTLGVTIGHTLFKLPSEKNFDGKCHCSCQFEWQYDERLKESGKLLVHVLPIEIISGNCRGCPLKDSAVCWERCMQFRDRAHEEFDEWFNSKKRGKYGR